MTNVDMLIHLLVPLSKIDPTIIRDINYHIHKNNETGILKQLSNNLMQIINHYPRFINQFIDSAKN